MITALKSALAAALVALSAAAATAQTAPITVVAYGASTPEAQGLGVMAWRETAMARHGAAAGDFSAATGRSLVCDRLTGAEALPPFDAVTVGDPDFATVVCTVMGSPAR